MATHKMTLRPCRSYREFLHHILEPVESPPAGEKCAICRSSFVEEQGQQPQEVIDYGTTTQARILAAALAAAAAEDEIHDVAVRIRRCGHFFHKDCLCTWITNDVLAEEPRRSCPYCKTELVRFDKRAWTRAWFHSLHIQIEVIAQAVSVLDTVYHADCEPIRKLEEMEVEVAVIIDEYRRNEISPASKHSRKLLKLPLAKLRYLCKDYENWPEDSQYLEQLSLDGHTISESIRLWYIFKVETAQEIFHRQSTEILLKLWPLQVQAEGLHRIVVQLVATLIRSDGESQIQAENEAMETWGFVEVLHIGSEIPDEIFGNPGGDWREHFCDVTGVHLSNAVEVLELQRRAVCSVKFELEQREDTENQV